MVNHITTFNGEASKGKVGEEIVKNFLLDEMNITAINVDNNPKWRYKDVDFICLTDELFGKKFDYSINDLKNAFSKSKSKSDNKVCKIEVKTNLNYGKFVIEDISKIVKDNEFDLPTEKEIHDNENTGWFKQSEADFYIIIDMYKVKNGKKVNWKTNDFDGIVNNEIWVLPNDETTHKEYELYKHEYERKSNFSYGTRDNWFSYYRYFNINKFSGARRIK